MGKSKDLASGAAYQDQTESDTRYVNTTGDTMSGKLTVQNDQDITGTLTHNPSGSGNKYLALNTASSGDGHIVLQRALANKYQITAKTDNSYSIYGYPASGEVFNINSSGHVTTPNQPFFQAFSPATSTAAGSDIVYGGTYHNIGSHYSTSTGIFTAPVAGRYLFTASCLFNYASGGYHRLNFRFNGSVSNSYAETLENQAGTNYSTATTSAIFNMSANDTMKMSNGSSVSTYGSSYGHFSGILLG